MFINFPQCSTSMDDPAHHVYHRKSKASNAEVPIQCLQPQWLIIDWSIRKGWVFLLKSCKSWQVLGDRRFNHLFTKPPTRISIHLAVLTAQWRVKHAEVLLIKIGNGVKHHGPWSELEWKDPVEPFGKLTKGKVWKKKQQIKKKQIIPLLFLGRNPQLLGVPKPNYCCVDPPIHWPKMSYISSNGRGWDYQQKKKCQLFLVKKKPSLLPRVATSYWAFCCFGCCGVEPPLHIRYSAIVHYIQIRIWWGFAALAMVFRLFRW